MKPSQTAGMTTPSVACHPSQVNPPNIDLEADHSARRVMLNMHERQRQFAGCKMIPRANLILEHRRQAMDCGTIGCFWVGWPDGNVWQSQIGWHNIRDASRNAVLQHTREVA